MGRYGSWRTPHQSTVLWLVHSVVITDWTGSSTRQVGADYVEYKNVSSDDVHVLQCNASNVHGYLFVNAFLNVLGRINTKCTLVSVRHKGSRNHKSITQTQKQHTANYNTTTTTTRRNMFYGTWICRCCSSDPMRVEIGCPVKSGRYFMWKFTKLRDLW